MLGIAVAGCTAYHIVERKSISLSTRPPFIAVHVQAGQEEAEVRVEDAAEQASSLLGMQFTRLIASSGFQLVNVNNVAIELKVLLGPWMPLPDHVHSHMLQGCTNARLSHATALSAGKGSGQQASQH